MSAAAAADVPADVPAERFDLVVVGAGAGGMTAALVAARQGLRVVLCESTQQVGGTTATSAGTLWLPGNRHGAQAGHADSVAEAARYLDALCGPDDPRGLRQAYLACAAQAIDDLERHTRLAFASSGKHPDYLARPGAAVAGRAISPVEFDGRLLGADFDRIRPPMPEFMVLGGMMAGKADVKALVNRWRTWPDTARTLKLVLRYARDRLRWRRGTRLVMGNALVARLFLSLRDAGVTLRFGWRLQSLQRHVQDGGRVSGAWFDTGDGPRRLDARAGVVLACGGVGHHAGLRREWGLAAAAPGSLAAESVNGQGLQAARDAGAAIERHPGDFLWQPVSTVPRADGGQGLFPHLYLDRTKPGLIAVDGTGRRFANEADSYHHFVEAMLHSPGAATRAAWWLLCDADFIRRWGLGVIAPGTTRLAPWVARGYLVTAPTLAALAAQLGVDAGALQATVERHNGFAQTGQDKDFGKGASELNRFNGDPAPRANPCLGPIQTPPFCAVAVWPSDAASSSGLATDADGCVLSAQGGRIPGLYACGNDAASIMRGQYPGPGATLGPAIVFGWRIGRHAAAAVTP